MVGRVDHAVGDDGVLEELLGLAHLGRSEKILKQVNKYKLKTGRTAGGLAHLVRPAQLHGVAQAVQEPDKMFFCNEGTSKIVLYLKLA